MTGTMHPEHPARSHCWHCGQRVTADEPYYTLTVPFGPVVGVEHETCPLADEEQVA